MSARQDQDASSVGFFQNILDNDLDARAARLAALGVFVAALTLGLFWIISFSQLTEVEYIYFSNVRGFVDSPNLQAPLSYQDIKVSLMSLPFRAGAAAGETTQVFLIRLLGLSFFLLSLWFIYQTCQRIFSRNHFISLAALSVTATSNVLLSTATTVGGDAFALCFFAFFLYEIVEISTKGQLLDILLALVMVFLLSQVDFVQALRIALPALVFSIGVAMVGAYRSSLSDFLDRPKMKLAVGGLGILLVLASLRLTILEPFFFLPAAVLIGASQAMAWPGLLGETTAFFSSTPRLAENFGYVHQGILITVRLTALLAALGLGRWLALAIRDRVVVVGGTGASLDGNESKSFRITLKQPKATGTVSTNVGALLSIALVPLAVFAAKDFYKLGGALDEYHYYWLVLPAALLLGAGLKSALKIERMEPVALTALGGALTLNTAAILLSFMFR